MTTKADELRKQAKEAYQRSIDSFDRCDTDGFLSQWASDCAGRLLEVEADLAEHDYLWNFNTLGDKDGNLIPNKKIKTKYGYAYAIFGSFEDLEKRDVQILEWVGTSEKVIAKKGYTLIRVQTKGKAVLGEGFTPSAYIAPVVPFFTPENSTIVK